MRWWARQDLNLQEFPHVVLSHARLPFRHAPKLMRTGNRHPTFTIKPGQAKPILTPRRMPGQGD